MAGNIDPQTGTFTLAGMVLGNETYETEVQNSLAHNAGYLLYHPRVVASSGEVWDVDDAPGTRWAPAYIEAGTYDIQAAVYWNISAGNGSALVTIDGTQILYSKQDAVVDGIDTAGTLAGYIVPSGAWFKIAVAANGTNTAEIRGWAVQVKQFGA
jgi:hypothetical protein